MLQQSRAAALPRGVSRAPSSSCFGALRLPRRRRASSSGAFARASCSSRPRRGICALSLDAFWQLFFLIDSHLPPRGLDFAFFFARVRGRRQLRLGVVCALFSSISASRRLRSSSRRRLGGGRPLRLRGACALLPRALRLASASTALAFFFLALALGFGFEALALLFFALALFGFEALRSSSSRLRGLGFEPLAFFFLALLRCGFGFEALAFLVLALLPAPSASASTRCALRSSRFRRSAASRFEALPLFLFALALRLGLEPLALRFLALRGASPSSCFLRWRQLRPRAVARSCFVPPRRSSSSRFAAAAAFGLALRLARRSSSRLRARFGFARARSASASARPHRLFACPRRPAPPDPRRRRRAAPSVTSGGGTGRRCGTRGARRTIGLPPLERRGPGGRRRRSGLVGRAAGAPLAALLSGRTAVL